MSEIRRSEKKDTFDLKMCAVIECLDSDNDWTDKLGAILDEELEECDEDGNSEVHPFKMLCSSI